MGERAGSAEITLLPGAALALEEGTVIRAISRDVDGLMQARQSAEPWFYESLFCAYVLTGRATVADLQYLLGEPDGRRFRT